MDFSIDKLRKRLNSVRALLVYDEPRRELILKWFNILFCIVAGFMTVVNVFTSKWLLFCSTLIFTLRVCSTGGCSPGKAPAKPSALPCFSRKR